MRKVPQLNKPITFVLLVCVFACEYVTMAFRAAHWNKNQFHWNLLEYENGSWIIITFLIGTAAVIVLAAFSVFRR